MRAYGLDRLRDAVHSVGRKVVHYNELSGPKHWTEEFSDEGQKDVARGGTWDRHRGQQAIQREGANDGEIWSVVDGASIMDPLPAWAPRVATCHRSVGAALVDENQVARGKSGTRGNELLSQLGYALSIPFRGMESLFFRVSPKRSSARCTAAPLTTRPRSR